MYIQKNTYFCSNFKVMRTALGLILLVFLMSCEKYEMFSNPQLNINGKWKMTSVTAIYNTTLTDSIKILPSDYYALTPFRVVTTQNNFIQIKNDTTNVKGCFFYKVGYTWEIDYNRLIIKTNQNKIVGDYSIWYGDQYYSPNTFSLRDFNTNEPIPGVWYFKQNGKGANPSGTLELSVPEIWLDIFGSQRSFQKAINQSIVVSFLR